MRRLASDLPSLLLPMDLSGDTLCLREDLPVAGKLREFLPSWEEITSEWVLGILRRGYSIKLLHVPHFCRGLEYKVPLA